MREPPVRIIEPGRRSLAGEWRELVDYRDLLYFLIRRHVSVRYKQTVLGVSWAVIQPFMTMVVFSVFLGRLAGVPSDGVPYPVFSYLGLLPWTYFSGAVARASQSLVSNANLLGKVYFPRVLIPLSAVISAFVDFAIASVVLVGIMAWYGIWPAPSAVWIVPLSLLTALNALGVGAWLAALRTYVSGTCSTSSHSSCSCGCSRLRSSTPTPSFLKGIDSCFP